MHLKQISKFSLVGIWNTILDFIVLNIGVYAGLPLLLANVVSVTIAMSISYELNRRFVFDAAGERHRRQVIQFVAVTATGLYVLQTSVIFILTDVWLWPLDTLTAITGSLGLHAEDIIRVNGAKFMATVVTFVWNYSWYHTTVFNNDQI